MVSRKADAIKPVPALAHQFDCVHGSDPVPQSMIQLVGCHIERDARFNRRENAGGALRRAGKRKASTEYEKAQNDWNGVSLRE
jgi:hypothetical protein